MADTVSEARRSVPADALFVLIGARPRTHWLGDSIARDRRGFVLTGPDLPAGTALAPRPPAAAARDQPARGVRRR